MRIPKLMFVAFGMTLNVVALAVLMGSSQLNSILEFGVERALSYVCQTDVAVDKVFFDPAHERIEIEGMTIQNPLTYLEGNAVQFAKIGVDYDTKSFLTSSPTIRKIALQGTKVSVQYNQKTGTNLAELAQQAQSQAAPDSFDAPQGTQRKFVVQELDCDGLSVDLSANLGPGTQTTVHVEPFSLGSPDGSSSTVTAGELMSTVLRGILEKTANIKGLNEPATKILWGEVHGMAA